MGTRLPFCIRRGAIFYWRRRLPSPAKMSVEFSLGTKDERVARRLCASSGPCWTFWTPDNAGTT
jgi:hypothetical protein